MELKDKLYNLRKKNGYTQSALAEILDVSRQSISNWELGTILPSTSRLKKLSELYSVPLEALLDDGIEIQLHPEPPQAAAKEGNQEMPESSSMQSGKKAGRINKILILSLLGVLVALAAAVTLYFLTAGDSKSDTTTLEQLGNEEVTISAENGFDFQ